MKIIRFARKKKRSQPFWRRCEIAKLSKEKQRLEQEIKRSEGMLHNPGFVNKAPAAKVAQEKEKLEGYRRQYEITCHQLKSYEGK